MKYVILINYNKPLGMVIISIEDALNETRFFDEINKIVKSYQDVYCDLLILEIYL